jgi:hypothetical protein
MDKRMIGAPRRIRRQFQFVWLLGGLALGVVFTLLALVVLTPQRDFAAPASTGGGDLTITMDDAYLTSAVRTSLSHAKLPVTVSHVRAHALAGNMVEIGGDVTLLPGLPPRPMTARMALNVVDHKVAVTMLSSTLGGLQMPSPVLDGMQKALNAQLGASISQLGGSPAHYRIDGVQTTDGSLTLQLGVS